VLISKFEDKIYATGSVCSHYKVSLEGGMLFGDKLMCPAHCAAFSVVTGEPEYAPALDGIPTYPVVQKDEKHFVSIPADGKMPKNISMPLTNRDPANKTRYLIVGGGPAGLSCAETLR
jgi:apoptosis-inducing factor 3